MIAPCLLLALAAMQPPSAAAPAQPPLDWRTLEAGVLKEPVQITSRERFIKAGEAYFSHDDRWVVFQAVETPAPGKEADPFYAMYVAPVKRDESGSRIIGLGDPVRVSEPGTANTCGWFDPVRTGMVIFGSTITRPADEQKSGFQVGTRRYVWMFPAEMEVVERAFLPMLEIPTTDGGMATTAAQAMASLRMELEQLKAAAAPTPAGAATGLARPAGMKRAITAEMVELDLRRVEELAPFEGPAKPVFTKPNYDAECSYSSDGRFILYAHVETPKQEGEKANADISIYDTVTKRHHAIVVGPGYDGGPFFSPDDKRICYRSDRKGDDLLQLFVADLRWVDGVPVGMEREYQITDNGAVNWAPYFSRDGGMLIYGSSEVGHHNYELFAVKLDAAMMAHAASGAGNAKTVLVNDLPRVRLTHADGADVLPVFSNDGKTVMWTSQRGPKVQGEARPSSQLWVATWGGLPAR
jgi:hypothetical protein